MNNTTVNYKDAQKEAMLEYTTAWYKMFPFSNVRFETYFEMDSIIIKTDMYVKGQNCAFRRTVSSLIFPRVINELLKEASSEYTKRVMSI